MEGDHNWGKVYGVKIAENGRGVIESGRVVYESFKGVAKIVKKW